MCLMQWWLAGGGGGNKRTALKLSPHTQKGKGAGNHPWNHCHKSCRVSTPKFAMFPVWGGVRWRSCTQHFDPSSALAPRGR